MIEHGFADDSYQALTLVVEGKILVNGQRMISPAQLVNADAKIAIREEKYVGRGASKLEAAIQKFEISVKNKVCADIGSATGGFVEILLKYGAKKVYAIDTARGKLALKLREDPRVVVMERIDVRDLKNLPEQVDLITIDVSLISLRQILPAVRAFLNPNGFMLALFKPQYETRDSKLLKHGVIRDAAPRETLLESFIGWTRANCWQVIEWMESPIRGDKGNLEYLVYLKQS